MDVIRIGVVGAGRNTIDRHIPGLQAIEGVEVVSVCNRSRASSERVAQQFGIPTVYESWAELIEAPDTDAIMIGTWPYRHCALTLAAISAGKHVLPFKLATSLDKPLESECGYSLLWAFVDPRPYGHSWSW